MSVGSGRRLLLGPQRPTRNIDTAVAEFDIGDGPVAVISAGWQEAEGDIDDVRELVGRELIDLALYRRAEQVYDVDAALKSAYRVRQDRLMALQRLYRRRLRQLSIAAREMLRADGDPDLLAAEQRHAVAQLRALDRHHLRAVEAIYCAFEETYGPRSYEPLAAHVEEIDGILSRCRTVLITGGNVVVTINRMRLFGIADRLQDRDLIAWSGGAMVLADRIVLFHDRAPQGRRDPELLVAGAGILPGYVFLPDAARRLRLKDLPRAGLFSRRFAPDSCVTLDCGAALRFRGADLTGVQSARRISHAGGLERIRSV